MRPNRLFETHFRRAWWTLESLFRYHQVGSLFIAEGLMNSWRFVWIFLKLVQDSVESLVNSLQFVWFWWSWFNTFQKTWRILGNLFEFYEVGSTTAEDLVPLWYFTWIWWSWFNTFQKALRIFDSLCEFA